MCLSFSFFFCFQQISSQFTVEFLLIPWYVTLVFYMAGLETGSIKAVLKVILSCPILSCPKWL